MGYQKALMLLKSLGENASAVLAQLPPDIAQELSHHLQTSANDVPTMSNELAQEAVAKLSVMRSMQRQQAIATENVQIDPMKELASKLVSERVQTIAFFTSFLEDSDRATFLQFLPFTLQEAVKKCEVAHTPMSHQAYDALLAKAHE